ncbi:hypothetical protein [Verrucomicrobium sp. BvORR106]|uniref:hypothetical protein n=1 Tax=Verrucomicrobium sp. BvORR106 TaxID=1403819 RepID=UPI00056DE3E5|nr:hypothetical protein [Verrucomicrobium sp. BvORR106]
MLSDSAMLKPRWTYSNVRGLTQWYGHVDYYGPYVIGQWFALDAETGTEHWSHKFHRPTSVCDCAHDVIIATESRSDGPWTADFGIYGIDAPTGKLLWTNHGRGFWGRLLRCLDFVPGFTNEFRDTPKCIVDQYVITWSGRILDIRTGLPCPSANVCAPEEDHWSAPERVLYEKRCLEIDGDDLLVQGAGEEFEILRRHKDGRVIWQFAARERSFHVDGNYYSYRLHGGRIFIILGDAPNYVPIKASNPMHVKPNPANYHLGVLDVSSGECKIHRLTDTEQRTGCRIEAIREDRILISCEGTQLLEYAVPA